MAGRQVNPGDVTHLGEAGEPLIAVLRVLPVLLSRVSRADDRGRDVQPRVVRELNAFAEDATRLGDGPPLERLLLLRAEPVEVLLLLDRLPVEGLLNALEVG